MTRSDSKTVAKVQSIVLLVKGADRFHWPVEKQQIGGFKDPQQEQQDQPLVPLKKNKPAPVIKGTEYPELLGQKVKKDAPTHKGPIRWFNFKEEAYNKLSAHAKSEVDNHSRKTGSLTVASTSSSASEKFSSSFGAAAISSSSSRSVSSSSSSIMQAQGKGDDSPSIHPRIRSFEAFDEDEAKDDEEMNEEANMIKSILSKVKSSMDIISNVASAKDDDTDSRNKRPREHRQQFVIPEYHAGSKGDDEEGIDMENYGMSVTQIDESLFGRHKYNKGNSFYPLLHFFTSFLTCFF